MKRPKDMTEEDRNLLPVGAPPSKSKALFMINDGDILAVEDLHDGTTWGFARNPDQSWFRYRIV